MTRIKLATLRVAKVPPVAVAAIRVATLSPEARGINTSRGARTCAHCQGTIRDGNWLHDLSCPFTVIQYNRYTTEDRWRTKGGTWPCPYHCVPTPLSMGRTHHWACPFWQEHPQVTPF